MNDVVLDPDDLFDLDERVIIVTGASSGLGAHFARFLNRSGARVVLAARRADRLEALASELNNENLAVTCDVTSDESIAALVSRVLEVEGRIDVLVNNAGAGGPAPAEQMDMADFRASLDVNLTGLFSLTQQVARPMIEQGSGSIINIASVLGLVAATPIKHAAYCAAKGAVVNLTRQLGAEWARKGVRVNAIAPGWFPSEMTQEKIVEDPAGLKMVESNTPMGRMGLPHELDGALMFLASKASSYVTGHTLVVDGGWVAR